MNIAEKWNDYKTWKKAKIEEFNEKHPKLSSAIIKTQAVIGVGLIYWPDVKPVEDSSNEMKSDDPWTRGWKEEYRENYDKVCDFASSLDLCKGEQFIIEDAKQYEGGSWFTGDGAKPIVSHLVYGDGCYPPEED